MATLADKAIQRALKAVNAFAGETYTFRGVAVVGVPDFNLTQKDVLKFEPGTIPSSVVKIEIREEQIPEGGSPVVGEYLYSARQRYEIFAIDYRDNPSRTYILLCSGSER